LPWWLPEVNVPLANASPGLQKTVRGVALQTAKIHAMTRLPLPDAVLVASALLSSCQAIITNDREWRQRLQSHFPRFQWVYLSQ